MILFEIIILIYSFIIRVDSWSFLDNIFFDDYAFISGHNELCWVIITEICLNNISLTFGNQISSIALDCLAQIPYDCVLTKATNDESLQWIFVLIKLGRQKLEIFHSIFLQVLQSYFKFNWCWSWIERHLLIEKRDIIVIFSWYKPKIFFESSKHPFSIFCGI